ncbi:hypothetical protein P280DRAFT_20148 [Massarina eburnea CBS 473.64]|uniref:Ubiquitin-like protease family profile domain-containing protein n=1 Tax=Massarina eburnea CBS 473.64 TaxID=1395130 RepID=A0A6A6SGF8_9PLEO|nr:hypothetical protein P280DRAFT_20148 [Massarina eburnea CBS 473.64]
MTSFIHLFNTAKAKASSLVGNSNADIAARDSSRSPTTHSRGRAPTVSSRTVDLTEGSPPRPKKRPASEPDHADARPRGLGLSRPSRVVSADEQRLVPGNYKKSADGTPVPSILTWRVNERAWGASMAKPGAKHALKPMGFAGSPSAKTFSHRGQAAGNNPMKYSRFLEDNNELPPNPHGPAQPAKRRKTEHSEVINLEDEGGDDAQNSLYLARSSPSRPSRPRSRRSAGSGHVAFTPSHPRSEFEDTTAIVNPRHRPARVTSSPPTILKDSPARAGPDIPRLMQMSAFTQGKQQAAEKVTSPHFPTVTPKINLSTGEVRMKTEQARRKPADASNLRDQFSRNLDVIESSDDELAPKRTTKTKQLKQPAAMATSSISRREMPSEGWPLKYARCHDFEESTLISLRRGAERVWRVVATHEDGTKHTIHELHLRRITSAVADDKSRIRISGSQASEDCQYLLDLQFANTSDFRRFRNDEIAPATTASKVSHRDETWMQDLFNRPMLSRQEIAPSQSNATGSRLSQSNAGVSRAQLPRRGGLLEGLKGNASTAGGESSSLRAVTRTARITRTRPNYVEVQEAPEKLRFSEEFGLGPPWKRQLTYGSGRRRAVVDFSDLPMLDEEQCLNDSLIEFYMIYLSDRLKLDTSRVYFFNTHFFTTLTRRAPGQKGPINYSGVARWTAKEDLFNYDYIVVPINQEYHWYLAIICNVRNIARKPALDDLEETSAPQPKALNESDSAQPVDSNEGYSTDTSRPINAVPAENATPAKHEDEMLFDEASLLDVVDLDATRPKSSQTARAGSLLSNDSTAVESAKLEQLSLADSTYTGILPKSSSSPLISKKFKRKSALTAKKWDPEEPCIIILDSLGGVAKSGAVRALKDYIHEEGREKRSMHVDIKPNAFYAKGCHVPMQDNFSDCGVYLLGYTQKFFEDPDGFKDRLLKQEMQAEEDWPDMSIPEMRTSMRDILKKLYAEQDAEHRRVQQAKRGKKPVTGTQPGTSPADAVSGTIQVSTSTSNNTAKKEVKADPEPTPNPPTGNNQASVPFTLKVEEPTVNGKEPANPRLASPFESRWTKQRVQESPLPIRSEPAKAKVSPEKSHDQESRVTLSEHSPSPARPRHIRSTSPLVVINASPHVVKRRHGDHVSNGDASNSVTSPKRQKMDPTGETTISHPQFKEDMQSPKRKVTPGESTASSTTTSKRTNIDAVHNDLDDGFSVIEIKSPPQHKHDVPRHIFGKERTNGSRPSKSPQAAKSRRSPDVEILVEPPKNAIRKSPLANKARGSPCNPISIEDSQETVVDSQDLITVAPPKAPRPQAVETLPDPVRSKKPPASSPTPRKRQDDNFIGNALDVRLKTAASEEMQHDLTEDSEVSWNGCSDKSTVIIDENDEVPESPVERTKSPGVYEWSKGEPLPL